MDTIEKFYIDKETKNSNQINDKNTVKPNIIFDIVVREETDRVAHSHITTYRWIPVNRSL
jgi:hypothetical protein